jgi:3-hydroxy-3-methylglutaryl CoA synthase
VNVAEYVYTDGVFAETSYLNMVEQLVAEYEQSLEKKDK